jgi:predicted nucleotidyltransferase
MRATLEIPLEEAIERLKPVFDREGVVAASLFGSQARGKTGALSDIDIAVWLDPELASRERFNLWLELVADAQAALRSEVVDVVKLNDAPPELRHGAIRDGRRLVDRDPRQRVRLEADALLEYLDTGPLRAELAQGLRHRLAEGRFGRR